MDDTLTPKDEGIPSQKSLSLGFNMPYGRLITCKQYLKSIDLVDRFSFGRSEECSLIVTAQTCPKNIIFNISKIHFLIERCEEDNTVYIKDLSKNGTFVNQVRIGNGNRKILTNDDTIAITKNNYAIFVFMSLQGIEDFLPPVLLPKFVNIKRLGRGSCGEVRLVKDRDTFHPYAVKKIALGESNSSLIHKINHPTKIVNEINILRSLIHPCIIRCHDIEQDKREVFLVLEYMSGGELTKRIFNSPMMEDTAKFYFLQMISAVQYLHSNGVIHRDLKPENILLRDSQPETLLKITDFGLSKITYASDLTTMCGTLRYAAPEILNTKYRESGEYGRKVDVWSLGVILFFMISREHPFSGETNLDLAKNIVKCKVSMSSSIWNNVSSDVKKLIKEILVVQPKNRLSLPAMMNHPWIKNDFGVKFRVENLLLKEGLENPFQDLILEPPEKKFKFNGNPYSDSAAELDSTLVYCESSSYSNSPTICY